MQYIDEKTNKTKISDSCDVLVAGGGVAGIAAALSALAGEFEPQGKLTYDVKLK